MRTNNIITVKTDNYPSLFAATLALAIAFTFNACSDDGNNDSGDSSYSNGSPSSGSSSPSGGDESSSSGTGTDNSSSSSIDNSSSSQSSNSSSTGIDNSSSSNGGGCTSETHYCYNGTGTLKEYGYVSYGEQTYKTVVIGSQTWMAENLNYAASGSKCKDNNSLVDYDTETCGKYGRLYNWTTAMANSAGSSANPSGVRGVCPPDWHLPSQAEWFKLDLFVGSSKAAKLKATSGWNDYGGKSGNGTDNYGFSAIPGGNHFYGTGDGGYWWSTTPSSTYGNLNIYHVFMGSGTSEWDLSANPGGDRNNSYLSVRCVKDE